MNNVEASTVVFVFGLYLVRLSLLAVVQALRERGERRKTWMMRV